MPREQILQPAELEIAKRVGPATECRIADGRDIVDGLALFIAPGHSSVAELESGSTRCGKGRQHSNRD